MSSNHSTALSPALQKAIAEVLASHRQLDKTIWAGVEADCLAEAYPESGLSASEIRELILESDRASVIAGHPDTASRREREESIDPDARPGDTSDQVAFLKGTGMVVGGALRISGIQYAIEIFPSPVSPRLLAKGSLAAEPSQIANLVEGAPYSLVLSTGDSMTFIVVGGDVTTGFVRVRMTGPIAPPAIGRRSIAGRRSLTRWGG